ncbi:MAG: anthranilate phosphoribosyltransferase [Methanomassiliicoccus sp.]|nr:anthranilate phosphoribosyltransferase [Methanomassiliicoccus sp.]
MITENPEALADMLVSGTFSHPLMVSTLTEMASRGETPREVAALATAFRRAAVPVRTHHAAILDMCGTGGASFRTFNVSSIASLVVSSLGVPVAKHGNRSNRGCGSADFFESIGARLSLSPEEAGTSLDELDFAFLFAPSFHPAMRHAVPVRKEISTRTVFNMLGPLLNPVDARRRQLIGVYSPRLLDLFPPVLSSMGVERALIVHGRPGMDEVSVLGPTAAVLVNGDRTERFLIDPREMGLYHPVPGDVGELTPALSASTAYEILGGRRGARRDMVVLNAACGLLAFGAVKDLDMGVRRCEAAIDSGRAMARMNEYIARTRRSISS